MYPDSPPPASTQSCTQGAVVRSEEHTSELQSPDHLVGRLLLEKKAILARDPATNPKPWSSPPLPTRRTPRLATLTYVYVPVRHRPTRTNYDCRPVHPQPA